MTVKRFIQLAIRYKTIFGLRQKYNHNSLKKKERARKRFIEKHGKCNYCPRKSNLTIDHIIPKSKGGRNTQDNWQVLCKKCNNKKASKIYSQKTHDFLTKRAKK